MKKTFALVLSLFAGISTAAPDKIAYELSEKCGKQVAQDFRREFSTGIDRPSLGLMTTYRSHYNSKRNACLYLQIVTGTSKAKNQAPVQVTMQTLFDFNENREIGTFYKRDRDTVTFACKVDEKSCTTLEEWQQLLKPYMED